METIITIGFISVIIGLGAMGAFLAIPMFVPMFKEALKDWKKLLGKENK